MWRFCSSPRSEAARSPSGAQARAPHKAEGWGLTCSGRRWLCGRGSPSLLLPRLCADQSPGPLTPATGSPSRLSLLLVANHPIKDQVGPRSSVRGTAFT